MDFTSDIMDRQTLTSEELALFISKLFSVYAKTEDDRKMGEQLVKNAYTSVFWTLVHTARYAHHNNWCVGVGLASNPMAYYLKYVVCGDTSDTSSEDSD
jgi:hypothetical protein